MLRKFLQALGQQGHAPGASTQPIVAQSLSHFISIPKLKVAVVFFV